MRNAKSVGGEVLVAALGIVGITLLIAASGGPARETRKPVFATIPPVPTIPADILARIPTPSPTPRSTLTAWPRPCHPETRAPRFPGSVRRCLVDVRADEQGEDRRYLLADGRTVEVYVRAATESARPAPFDREVDLGMVPEGTLYAAIQDSTGTLRALLATTRDGQWIGAVSDLDVRLPPSAAWLLMQPLVAERPAPPPPGPNGFEP